MNRRSFLKSLFTLVGVTAIAPKVLIEEPITKQLPVRYIGRDRYDVGYFYCPYIPLEVTSTTPLITLNTRYD